ncbi:unnamed protein product, partial [Vitis vinifera]|uniref:Uncharacterized protein n=1 Tax=Vitis vinifera TaxID=29760 RepID=D7SWT0_VITVI
MLFLDLNYIKNTITHLLLEPSNAKLLATKFLYNFHVMFSQCQWNLCS